MPSSPTRRQSFVRLDRRIRIRRLVPSTAQISTTEEPIFRRSTQGKPEEPAATVTEIEPYLGRLTKMVPAGVVAFYMTGEALVQPADPRPYHLLILALIGLAILLAVRTWATRAPELGLGPEWGSVAIAVIAYAIWLHAIGGSFEAYKLRDEILGAILVLGWTTLVPIVYRGH